MAEDEIEWIDSTEFPDIVSDRNSNCTVDVLVYSKRTDEHTIGWFNFKQMQWAFLCREAIHGEFKWRYLTDKHDRYGRRQKRGKEITEDTDRGF